MCPILYVRAGNHSCQDPTTAVVGSESRVSERVATLSILDYGRVARNPPRIGDSESPVVDVISMNDLVSNSLASQRSNLFLLAAFAGLALVLTAAGIYSVLSYTVRRRVREIGIRMTLGASQPMCWEWWLLMG